MLWSVLIAGIGINITLLHRTGEGAPVWTTILSRATNILGAADAVDNSKRDDSGTANDGYLYWAEVTNAHPDYRDAHVNAAIYAYRLGLHEKVLLHVRKVEALDPNYSGLSDLKDLLGEN